MQAYNAKAADTHMHESASAGCCSNTSWCQGSLQWLPASVRCCQRHPKHAAVLPEPDYPAGATDSAAAADNSAAAPVSAAAADNSGSRKVAASSTSAQPLLPPQACARKGMKTLVLDLDETLVHSCFRASAADHRIRLVLDHDPVTVYIHKRPGVEEFLKGVTAHYEVVVFTASVAKYANAVIDLLDTGSWVDSRLFREACTSTCAGYVKDLSKLGRSLEDVLIIDNSPLCYALQPQNAIAIRSWKGCPTDCELYDLLPILYAMAQVPSIPNVLRDISQSATADNGDVSGDEGAAWTTN
eukprot:NODE_8820_length_1467_cov_12.151493.p1 GENE.NODE_8820_length_1467_cov_12.151493~~NODE_8820_length_1467_cov_12.151493.p1  ORF type:complete len:299 (+),score=23.42 NODE_8820_length_1467_cov_12.151493:104-1000(+)